MNTIRSSVLGLAASLCFVGAQAATLYTLPLPTAPLVSPGSMPVTFNAAAGAGNVSFEIQGYNTLDGDNGFIDIFHLSVNGVELFSGTWDLGGGGTNRILLNPNGATVTFTAATRTVDVSLPVSFANGSNAVTFAYDSPTTFEGTSRAGPQGLGDEGWGLNSITITGNAVTAVPEPETYAMMLGGLMAVSLFTRRRKRS
jgi:PEP-CTERM motif-containing protein